MKVLLVNPPVSRDKPQIPLGLLSIKATLVSHDVRILDLNFPATTSHLENFKPEVIGISGMSFQRDYVLRMARIFKQQENPIVLVGGIHATIAPDDFLSDKNVDYVIRGEAEVAFSMFLERLAKGESLSDVPNLGYRNDSGVNLNGLQEISSLDDLPFPCYESVNAYDYPCIHNQWDLQIPYETSRGCKNNCIFCSCNTSLGSYRVKSLNKIIDDFSQIEDIYRDDKVLLNIVSNCFTANRERVLEFSKKMTESMNNSFDWMCTARIDEIDELMIKAMKKSGLVRIFFGGESGCDEGLRKLRKNISTAMIKKSVKLCVQHGVVTEVGFIVGHPWEQKKDILRTLEFTSDLEKDGILTALYVCTPYPDTELYHMLERDGMQINTANSSNYDFHSGQLMFNHPFLSDSDIQEVLQLHEEIIENRPPFSN